MDSRARMERPYCDLEDSFKEEDMGEQDQACPNLCCCSRMLIRSTSSAIAFKEKAASGYQNPLQSYSCKNVSLKGLRTAKYWPWDI